jgi:hypothetical protein
MWHSVRNQKQHNFRVYRIFIYQLVSLHNNFYNNKINTTVSTFVSYLVVTLYHCMFRPFCWAIFRRVRIQALDVLQPSKGEYCHAFLCDGDFFIRLINLIGSSGKFGVVYDRYERI